VKVKSRLILGALRCLFEGAYYNTRQIGEVCAVYSNAWSIQKHGLIEGMVYLRARIN